MSHVQIEIRLQEDVLLPLQLILIEETKNDEVFASEGGCHKWSWQTNSVEATLNNYANQFMVNSSSEVKIA